MKKHDEGYALVFVLVVMVVLSTISLTLMTGAAKNLTAQANSVSQMQDKYLAQGEIEKLVAQICTDQRLREVNGATEEDVQQKITLLLKGDDTNGQPGVGILGEHADPKWSNDSFSIDLIAEDAGTKISCNITFQKIIVTNANGYAFGTPDIIYNSYTIEYTAPTEGGNG